MDEREIRDRLLQIETEFEDLNSKIEDLYSEKFALVKALK